MEELASSKLTEKKSKFFGYLYSVGTAEEIDTVVALVRSKNKKACHVCYGAVIDGEVSFKNDGEVGQPGKQLLSLLETNDYDSHILIVARIFGRVKLGPAGVGRAFKEAGLQCLKE
ncbi:MAG: YigZ family protein [Candidatus Woesearchaeota archaeon]